MEAPGEGGQCVGTLGTAPVLSMSCQGAFAVSGAVSLGCPGKLHTVGTEG